MFITRFIVSWAFLIFAWAAPGFCQDAETVKVYILAGQSNMEGKAPNALFEHQATDAKTAEMFSHLRKNDQWVVRDDVWIKYLNRSGGLTLGYGSRDRTGIELEFGAVLGDQFEQPVLLVKTCWGGHSLFKNFRPPSAGMPSKEKLQEEWERAKKNKQRQNEKRQRNDSLPTYEDITSVYGSSYRNMLEEVKKTRAKYQELFPALKGKELEIAGFVWFQGWNDQYGGAELEYESNMKHFINDVRKDLGVKDLPFVIGVMGQNGSKPAKGPMQVIQNAQLAMEQVPEFQGNVRAIRTDVLIDEAAETLYPEWKQRFDEWQKVGGDRPYHYLGSAIWFTRIGNRMAKAMLEISK